MTIISNFWWEMKFTIFITVFEIFEILDLLANIFLFVPFPESGTASLLSWLF